mmetsp:Transcript_19427/g.44208  ORF Transcript_19427/g.44208 Transcript_19427/m.44208 type:complete len:296 (-) Transcript_19427:914-1801(-)
MLAFFFSTSVSAICFFAAAISFSNLVMRAASASSFDSKSPLCSFLAYVAFSFSLNSLVQYALNSASSFCWAFSSATIVSIISLTFSKESSCAVIAKAERWARGPPAAPMVLAPLRLCHAAKRSSAWNAGAREALRNAATTRERSAAAAAEPCPSWSRLALLDSISWFSSSVRTAMASATAFNSSERVSERRSHSLSRSLHVNFSLRRNSTSAERCLRVRAKSSLASESAFWFAEWSPSRLSSFSFPVLICSFLAAESASYSSADLISSFCDVPNCALNSSSIWFRTPKISPDLAL